ncbi:hypothetical protein GQ43DRAFT_439238 [Delitschia confertaspora ATCC 74209]|uniref:DUF8021 domain-containing protein n=1 Tax=Delitschia confertaspora ATCC 74209 TaxID=1513339 RepID=A0A9P4JPG4_9PLEO|nr:hypothetical protein GQ43DRAFT_439238 [Delitschia confertaspora ATCC 74209]
MILPLILTSLASSAAAACSRDFLKNATSTYIMAQRTGQSSAVAALASFNLSYTENARTMSLRNSTLSQPIKIDFTRSAHDTVQCATFTEIIAATDPHPYVIHTRMIFGQNNQKASLIESIVTDQGDWLFNATGTLELNAPEKWDPIPTAQQDSRSVIQATGDAYFNRFGNANVTVPWGPPCYRVEGGLPARGTLNGDDCAMEWPSTIIVPYRRYVVDEELGVVDIFVGFPGLDRTQGEAPMPDSHLFRVEGGRIRYVHTASACVIAGCGI